MLALSLGFSACQPKITPLDVSCTQTNTSVPCLLKYAQESLDETDDSFSWVSSAAELSIAYDVTGNSHLAKTLITKAFTHTKTIEDTKLRSTATGEILTAIAELNQTEEASVWAKEAYRIAENLDARGKTDIFGKILVTKAIHGNPNSAFSEALALPQKTDLESYAKAITLRKIANIFAKSGDLKAAEEAIELLTMSIDYYQSMVRSDVARHAYNAGDKTLSEQLLIEADPIARSLGNGYFVGAALRDIGYSYHRIGKRDKADTYFIEALQATMIADKQNEKARSTSRIATRLSDAKLSSRTPEILLKAASFANDIEGDSMKSYSYYEITGAAAISGQFELSKIWLNKVPETPMGSTSSIKAAAKRDLAWGLTRYGKAKEALDVVKTIKADREKIQALSRMVRVIQDPNMEALPRYL